MPKNKNPLMLYARHKYLVERFNYWTNVKRRRYDDVIKILAYKECFYEEAVINRILKTWKADQNMEKCLKQELSFKPDTSYGPKLFED